MTNLVMPAQLKTPTAAVLMALVIMLMAGGAFNSQFFSPTYLLLQLQSGAFLGVIAAGAMLVILLGHIDLSVPWTLTVASTVATAVARSNHGDWAELGPIAGIAAGMAIGVLNGLGVAYLRIPSLIWTLAVNTILMGSVAFYAGNTVVSSEPSPLMAILGAGKCFGVLPNALLIWLAVSAAVVWLLRCTLLGRYLYAVGTREVAAYMSGIDTRLVVLGAFVASGACSAIAGLLLTGYAGQSYQRMGDPFLLPGIAAVVIGGTSILGGRGHYGGTVAGVLLITLMSSMLSLMHLPEAVKQICYGLVIIVMVGLYSRRQAT